MTIADVLTEAGLSTRAFYRHFTSKSDLLLAIYEHEVDRYSPRLQSRLDAAATPTDALDSLDRRAARDRVRTAAAASAPARCSRWAIPLQQEFPAEFAAVRAALTDPLEACSTAGRADGSFPQRRSRTAHAQFIRALTWELVEEHLSGGDDRRRRGARARCCASAFPRWASS